MTRYRFAERAGADLDEIWVTIAIDNVDAADRVTDQIHATAALLAENPNMGRARPELLPELRSFPSKTPYIIYYSAQPRGKGVVIVRVLHHARDVESVFGDDAAIDQH